MGKRLETRSGEKNMSRRGQIRGCVLPHGTFSPKGGPKGGPKRGLQRGTVSKAVSTQLFSPELFLVFPRAFPCHTWLDADHPY